MVKAGAGKETGPSSSEFFVLPSPQHTDARKPYINTHVHLLHKPLCTHTHNTYHVPCAHTHKYAQTKNKTKQKALTHKHRHINTAQTLGTQINTFIPHTYNMHIVNIHMSGDQTSIYPALMCMYAHALICTANTQHHMHTCMHA